MPSRRVTRALLAAWLSGCVGSLAPAADPSRVSFAIVEPPYEPAALAVAAKPDSEAP